MTGPNALEPAVDRRRPGGLAARTSPEGVAMILALALVVAVVGLRVTSAGRSGGGAGLASPSPSPSGASPARSPAVDPAIVRALLDIDRELLATRAPLEAALKATSLDTEAIRRILGQVSLQLQLATERATRLAADPDAGGLGGELTVVYLKVAKALDATFAASLVNQKAWRAGAGEVVALLGALPPLDARLRALLEGGVAASTTPVPSGSASGVPSTASVPPSRSPTPSATPVPPVTPPPSTGPTAPPSVGPTGSPAPSPGSAVANELQDPGFEAGLGPAWQLDVSDPAASATATIDTIIHATGAASARIDIAVPSQIRAGISLLQQDLALEAGARYLVTLAARSDATREIRVRVAAADGQTLGTHLFTIGPDWASQSFDFTSISSAAGATFAIDVGRGQSTVWLDDVSLGRIPPTP